MLKIFILLLALTFTACSSSNEREISDEIRQDIREVINSQRDKFKKCYEAILAKDPKATGKVILDFTIQPNGSVEKVRANEIRSTLYNNELNECLYVVFSNMKFPVMAGNDTRVVTYPFIFKDK